MDMGQRASEVFDFPLGTVLESVAPASLVRERYIFIGWMSNTVGFEAHFIRSVSGCRRPYLAFHYPAYNCVMAETLLKKFPDAARYLRDGDPT